MARSDAVHSIADRRDADRLAVTLQAWILPAVGVHPRDGVGRLRDAGDHHPDAGDHHPDVAARLPGAGGHLLDAAVRPRGAGDHLVGAARLRNVGGLLRDAMDLRGENHHHQDEEH